MAIGNLGSAMTQLQGYIASEFNASATQAHNQGLSLLPSLVRMIASRADLSYTNLRVTFPALNTSADADVEAGAVGLIAVVAQGNTTGTEDQAVLLYETNTVTEGTTRYLVALNLDQSSTVFSTYMAVFPEPIPFAALSWSAVSNGADTDIEGTELADASSIRVMLVYGE